MSDPTHELIRELASDLAPVRPLPRLRSAVLTLVGIWLGVAAFTLAWKGVKPEMWGALLLPIGPGGVVLGLLLAGAGGLVASLALALPGREAAARAGRRLAIAGVLLACLVGGLVLTAGPRGPSALDAPCLVAALAIALAPALAAAWFAGRAAPFHPLSIALAAATATGALGGAVAQVTCPVHELGHLLWGHAIAPALGLVVLTIPLLIALRASERAHPM